MARTDDFGVHREDESDSRSQTPEDAALHGQPVEHAPGLGQASSDDPDLAGSDLDEAERRQADPARLGDPEE